MAWSDTDVPKLNEARWWGPDELIGCQDTRIRKFKVEFKDSMIEDLKYRLKNSIYGPPLVGVGSTYGFNSNQLPAWIKYWCDEYPFKEREDFFNQFPQYKKSIQGLDIHFLWVKPDVTDEIKVLPLLLLHGWPGSVREFYEAIPKLTSTTTGHNFTFQVIAPSLPGFGFSDATLRPGLSPAEIAVIFKNLMNELGFEKFYIQGGDWGSIIATNLAILYPDNILGHHTNLPMIMERFSFDNTPAESLPKTDEDQLPPDAVEPEEIPQFPHTNQRKYFLENFGYYHLQATRPDSIGIALSDSPAGLLAYILQLFINHKDEPSIYEEDSGFSKLGISKMKLIDNLMVYWSTNTIMSSMRLYVENNTKEILDLGISSIPSKVPTWSKWSPIAVTRVSVCDTDFWWMYS